MGKRTLPETASAAEALESMEHVWLRLQAYPETKDLAAEAKQHLDALEDAARNDRRARLARVGANSVLKVLDHDLDTALGVYDTALQLLVGNDEDDPRYREHFGRQTRGAIARLPYTKELAEIDRILGLASAEAYASLAPQRDAMKASADVVRGGIDERDARVVALSEALVRLDLASDEAIRYYNLLYASVKLAFRAKRVSDAFLDSFFPLSRRQREEAETPPPTEQQR